MTRRRTTLRLLAGSAAATTMVALGACTDDGYSAPDRDVTFADVLDVAGTTEALSLDASRYAQAADVVAAANGFDPTEPTSYLDGARPHPDTVDFIVVCAWAAAAAAGDAIPEDVAAELRATTGDTGCDELSTEAVIVAVGQLAPGGSETDRPILLDRITLERAIYTAFAPEIAEAVAD